MRGAAAVQTPRLIGFAAATAQSTSPILPTDARYWHFVSNPLASQGTRAAGGRAAACPRQRWRRR
eukprot:2010750-Pyramimonas_sp.AAC.1